MLISLAWLRTLVPVTADDAEIGRRLTARGLTVDAVTDAGPDTVLDIDVPANRPDALGHVGVAREVAAAFGLTLGLRREAPEGTGVPAAEGVAVSVDDPALCGRYTARIVRNVRIAPSPEWVVARLTACGQRSINNVVDISNLVMLELGQPVHFFDLDRLQSRAIHVRASRSNESLTTLDGVPRTLAAGTIVIADGDVPVALGGIMGGASSQITASSRDVLIEAAWFTPAKVRQAARALDLVTDASQRFERGCDPEAPPLAQDLAVRLLVELAQGIPAPGMIDVRTVPKAQRALTVRLSRATRLLGYPVARDEAVAALRAVGLAPQAAGDVVSVTVPSWRVDLEREADLVEEIGRHLGYDRIPSRAPAEAPRPEPRDADASADLAERARDRLAALGFNEAFNYAMIGPGDDAAFVPPGVPPPLPLTNPISETLGFLRRSLLPGLLRSTDQNLRRSAADVRLFEVGGVFLARGPRELPEEPARVGFAWAGSAAAPHWSQASRPADAWDAAGLVEDLLATAHGERAFVKEPCDLAAFHPGRAIRWRDDAGRAVAWCGPLHPDLARRLDLPGEIWLGEAELSGQGAASSAIPSYRSVPRIPGTWRDLSIVLDPGVAAGGIVAVLSAIPSPAPASMTWIDRYSGPPLSPGQVAMTLRVILQPHDRTLTDEDVEAYRDGLVAALETVSGVRLRRIDT